jgi:intracellular multiplication protein IcmJ
MKLHSLKIQVEVPSATLTSRPPSHHDRTETACGFCGMPVGLHSSLVGGEPACILCGLVQSLNRPTIDDEVRLIWLSEMSQAALNVFVREVHLQLRELGESVFCDDTPRHAEQPRPLLYMAQRILLDRSQVIAERLGSSRASDLAAALTALSNSHVAAQDMPLGGLRVLPAGRFYIGGVNVYDDIVDSWRQLSTKVTGASPTASMAEAV